jgi:polysaccharide biosynthesis protein PslH
MRILQLCKKFPFPPKDGEVIAVQALSESFNKLGVKVTLLSMNTSKHWVDLSALPAEFSKIYERIEAVEINNNITFQGAFRNLFERESYHVSRFLSDSYGEKLVAILKQKRFDVVHLESIFLSPYIPLIQQHSKAKIAIRAHNVEHEIWDRIADSSEFFFKKLYLNVMNTRLRRFELQNIDKADILLPITERDLLIFRSLGFTGKALVTPVGFDSSAYIPDKASFSRPISIGFLGSLDWQPNQEGLKWLIDEVWLKYFADNDDTDPTCTVLHIAGRHAPDWLKNQRIRNIEFHGEVTDAKAFMNQHSIAIIPLLSGSGIRIKMLEAMLLGRVVLTTSMGMEGIGARDGEEILVANTPEEFFEKINFCLENPHLLHSMGEKARIFATEAFDNLKIAQNVLNGYSELCQKKNPHLTVNSKTV